MTSRLSTLWRRAGDLIPRHLPRSRRALTLTGWGVGFVAATTAATGPLALQLRFFTDPVPDNWVYAATPAVLSAVLLIVLFPYHEWIRHNGGTLYYLAALDRTKPDDARSKADKLAPRFLEYVPQRWQLPREPSTWQQSVEDLMRHHELLRAARGGGQRGDSFIGNSEWPVMWYLGHELSWRPDLWEREYASPPRTAEPAIDLVRLLSTPPGHDGNDPGLRVSTEHHGEPGTSGPLVVYIEATGTIVETTDFLPAAVVNPRNIHLTIHHGPRPDGIRGDPTGDTPAHTWGAPRSEIPRADFPVLVQAVDSELRKLFADTDEVYLLTRMPTSWPYALGALMREHKRLPTVRFVVWQGPGRPFALTDLVIPGRDPRPTPQSF